MDKTGDSREIRETGSKSNKNGKNTSSTTLYKGTKADMLYTALILLDTMLNLTLIIHKKGGFKKEMLDTGYHHTIPHLTQFLFSYILNSNLAPEAG